MSHLLDESKGYAAFFSVAQQAWHGLGNIIDGQPEYEEILKLGGLDYDVFKLPNVHRIALPFSDNLEPIEPIEIISDTSFFTYRDDVNKVLGASVGKGYTVIQNSEALGVVEELLKTKQFTIETAGAIKNGCQTFMTLKSVTPMEIGSNDNVDQYLVIMNSFDGSLPISIFFTAVRVVCNNTLQMALRGAKNRINIKHTKNGYDRLIEAQRALTATKANAEIFEAQALTMKTADKWSDEKVFSYFAKVFCSTEEIQKLKTVSHPLEALSTRKVNTLKGVIAYAENGIGQKEAIENSPWWAYNAVTGYVSHQPTKDAGKRMIKMLDGNDNALMSKALKVAVSDTVDTLMADFTLN
jgi:phage/plasmid-like protein (TIGR03299 family)